MTPDADDLLKNLLKCEREARAEAAVRLIDSLDPHGAVDEEAWADIAERRWQEIQSGKVKCRDAFEVLNEIESKLGR